jgi:hypothetical protein
MVLKLRLPNPQIPEHDELVGRILRHPSGRGWRNFLCVGVTFWAAVRAPKSRAATADSGWTAREPDIERSGIGRFQDNLRPIRQENHW